MGLIKGSILIVDDDPDIRQTAELFLRQKFQLVDTLESPGNILSAISEVDYDIILLDMNFNRGDMEGLEGLKWLRVIKEANPDIIVILITAYGEVKLAVEAMKEGANDFVLKPWNNEKLLASIMVGLNLRQSKKEIQILKAAQKVVNEEVNRPYMEMIGQSPAISRVHDLITKVADTDANILILGENGTGKELVARALHRKSSRCNAPFIRIDLGSISESLFESELFGHVKGSFTDAKTDRAGSFEIANGGTLFLDEIGNLSMNLQTKLLSVLQGREVVRVGSNKRIAVDVRLICATNMGLYEMSQKKNPDFRLDLLYRINTVEVMVPALHKRAEDIPLLLNHFMTHYARHYKKDELKIPDALMKRLMSYAWPGNVRELQHAVEKALILNDVELLLNNRDINTPTSEGREEIIEPETLEEMEEKLIKSSVKNNQGNLSKVAKELGITRATLYRKLEKYGI